MSARRLLRWVLLLALLSPAGARADCAPHRVEWGFRAASPVSPPLAVGADGRVFLGTHEGTVHGLGSDGQFLWSYTVHGGLLHGVTLDDLGRVYAMSSRGVLYGFEGNGAARWVFHAPMRAHGRLLATPRHALHFVSDSALYAVSSRGGVLWGVPLGSAPSSAPMRAPDGDTWLSTEDGVLHAIHAPFRKRQWALGKGEPFELLGVGEQGALLRLGERFVALGLSGEVLWSVLGPGRAAASRDGRHAVIVRDTSVDFHEFGSGQLLASVPHTARLSAAPAVHAELALLPRVDGRLDIVHLDGRVRRCALGTSLLHAPVPAPNGARVLVSAADGRVTAVVLEERAP